MYQKSHIWYTTCVVRLRIEQWLLHPLQLLSRDYCDIRKTLNSTPGLRGHTPCILVGITRASQECGQIWEKPRYIVNRVPLTKNSLQAPLVVLNYSVEYFHGKYWPVSGVQMSGEWREWRADRQAGGNRKKSSMSIIAQWRPYFHCQRIRPTQFVDPQLIMYFFFILRLLNNIFVSWSCWSMTYYESLATHVFRITVFWIIENVTF